MYIYIYKYIIAPLRVRDWRSNRHCSLRNAHFWTIWRTFQIQCSRLPLRRRGMSLLHAMHNLQTAVELAVLFSASYCILYSGGHAGELTTALNCLALHQNRSISNHPHGGLDLLFPCLGLAPSVACQQRRRDISLSHLACHLQLGTMRVSSLSNIPSSLAASLTQLAPKQSTHLNTEYHTLSTSSRGSSRKACKAR